MSHSEQIITSDSSGKDKDMIRILYIGEGAGPIPIEKLLPRQQGFSLQILPQWKKETVWLDHGQPDLICLEEKHDSQAPQHKRIARVNEIIKEIRTTFSQYPPAIFVIISPPTKFQEYLVWIRSRADKILISPLCPEQIKDSVSIYMEHRLLAQRCQAMQSAQKKATELLDRFYEEMKSVKQQLIEERQNLNQSLKQVQALTAERDRMRQEFAQMEKLWYQDQKGMEKILRTLIVKQVETNRGNGDRVALVADFLANELEIDKKSREALGKAARLYQLGRLALPALGSSEDHSDIQIRYPAKGAELLSQCSCFQEAGTILQGLNERSDGSGFPRGLKRRYIPLLTRILTGAVVFESLKDLPEVTDTDSLLDSLEKEAGTRLDPRIVGLLEKYIALHLGTGQGEKIRGVGVEQLKPGMRLGCSIFTHTGSKLFSAGTLLDQEAVNKVIRYNKSYPVDDIIYVKG